MHFEILDSTVMQISKNLYTGENLEEIDRNENREEKERNLLVNQVDIMYKMFCKIRHFRSFL